MSSRTASKIFDPHNQTIALKKYSKKCAQQSNVENAMPKKITVFQDLSKKIYYGIKTYPANILAS